MKKLILFLCVGLSIAKSVNAGFDEKTREQQRRKIVLQYLSNQSCLKKQMLNQEKEVNEIYNLFLVWIYAPTGIKKETIFSEMTKDKQQEVFWFYQKEMMQSRVYDCKYEDDCKCKKVNCFNNITMFYCTQVMKTLNYTLDKIFPEYWLIERSETDTSANKDKIKKQLEEFDKNEPIEAELVEQNQK